jgi:hypothetical protein
MKKSLIINYVLLLLLTILTIFTGKVVLNPVIFAVFILAVFGVKFLIVTFQFMELKKAHILWKISILITLSLLIFIVLAIR